MTTVLLLRHGRTNANLTGVLAGRSSGVELDEVGIRQAAASAERIAPLPIRAVVTSPLRRCRQTAKTVRDARKAFLAAGIGNAAGDAAGRPEGTIDSNGRFPVPSLVTDAGLIECGYGTWTGRSLRDLAKEKLWATIQQQPSAVRFPDGEAMTEMSARATAAIRGWDAKIAADHGDDAIWVAVSHGDVIKAILADALGMHLDQFQRIMVDPASISVIHYAGTRPFVLRMNSVGQDLDSLIPKPKPAKKASRTTKKSAAAPAKRSAEPAKKAAEPAKKAAEPAKKAAKSAARKSSTVGDAAIGGGLGTEDLT